MQKNSTLQSFENKVCSVVRLEKDSVGRFDCLWNKNSQLTSNFSLLGPFFRGVSLYAVRKSLTCLKFALHGRSRANKVLLMLQLPYCSIYRIRTIMYFRKKFVLIPWREVDKFLFFSSLSFYSFLKLITVRYKLCLSQSLQLMNKMSSQIHFDGPTLKSDFYTGPQNYMQYKCTMPP